MTVLLWLCRPRPSLGGIGEGVVKGIERVSGRNCKLKAITVASVLDRDGQPVLEWMPEQQDAEAVAVAGGEFAGLRCRRAHGSSCHGMSTSLTLVAVVRSAT